MSPVSGALEPPDPPLAVDELELRPWRPPDAAALVAAWHDPEVMRWSPVPEPRDEVAALRWIEAEPLRRQRGLALDLVVVEAARPEEVLGEVGLSSVDRVRGGAFVGYWVAPGARRRRVASRAVAEFARWALYGPLGLTLVVARCDPANRASHGVARTAGFRPAGRDGEGYELFAVRRVPCGS